MSECKRRSPNTLLFFIFPIFDGDMRGTFFHIRTVQHRDIIKGFYSPTDAQVNVKDTVNIRSHITELTTPVYFNGLF
jgi:hypothetical protein